MGKNINFKARSKDEFEVQPKPYPAVKTLPKWFKDESPYENNQWVNNETFALRNHSSNATFKKCVPLLDGMSSGYIIPLFSDVQVQSG